MDLGLYTKIEYFIVFSLKSLKIKRLSMSYPGMFKAEHKISDLFLIK